MSDNGQQMNPPFPPAYRASGVLMHVTSLPSPYGIGDIGSTARAWIDRLHEAGQTWWQALPLGPTGYGNSPYQSLSSFAGNWLLISPDDLIADGLVRTTDLIDQSWSGTAVNYDQVIAFKVRLLDVAWSNYHKSAGRDLTLAFEEFRSDQAHWLDDYALFRSLKVRYGGACYLDWPTELVERYPPALAQAKRELASQIDKVRLAQFLLFRQGELLKEYAHARGVRLIGDLPFLVSPDSSDVWANPELFSLDERRQPRFVAGVPPDFFSSEGQLWGNPVYEWEALQVLVMTVDPGFGHQHFLSAVRPKIRRIRQMIEEIKPGCDLEVDGGINATTAPMAVEAGANVLVAGSSIFGDRDGVATAMKGLRAAANTTNNPA